MALGDGRGIALEIDLYWDRLVNGARTGLVSFGNTIQVSLTPQSERVVRKSRKRNESGMVLDAFGRADETTITLANDEMADRDVLSAALMGSHTDLTAAGQSGQSATVTLFEGKWAKIPGADAISNVTITGKIAGTDFEVNPDIGMVKALNAGCAGDQPITFDVDAIADGYQVDGSTESLIEVYLLGHGRNLSDSGRTCVLEVPKAVLTPDGALDLMSEGDADYAKITWSGSMVVQPGYAAPYMIRMLE